MKPSLVLISIPLLVAVLGWAGGSAGQWVPGLLEQEARAGEPGAELLYGLALLEGHYGLPVDVKQGMLWVRRAAEHGNAFAALVLGNRYAQGNGVDKDAVQAVAWWRKAAQAGNAEAQYHLGKAFLEGDGVPRDDGKAAGWLEQAANNGDAEAQYLLGKMYHEGYRVVQDQTLARDWLSRAAAAGHVEATNLLALVNTLVKSSTMVSRESYEVLEDKAEHGDPHAQYELGLRYENGALDVNKNPAKALHWLTEAAENGNLLAMHKLSRVYAAGSLGVKKDAEKAAYWRQKAAGRHSAPAGRDRHGSRVDPVTSYYAWRVLLQAGRKHV